MIKIIDLKGEVGKLPMLRDRRPETTEAERKASGAFVNSPATRPGNATPAATSSCKSSTAARFCT